MPDPLSILYKENKELVKQNRSILSPDTQGTMPESPPIDVLRPIDFSRKTASPIEPISRYTSYIAEPENIPISGDPNYIRAKSQPVYEQLGNMAARIIPDVLAGTIQNFASMTDIEDYLNADDEVGSGLGSLMQDFIDKTNQAFPIYRTGRKQAFDIGNSGWWIDNASNLLNSAGSFALTGYITGGILGKVSESLARGLAGNRAASKIASTIADETILAEATGQQMSNAAIAARQAELEARYIDKMMPWFNGSSTIVNALTLNQAESIQEGMGVYKDVLSNKIQEGLSYDEAKQRAADAAALDVNINRVNFFSNLTSAGLFTGANKAIVGAMGGWKGATISESVQEGLEEGVNYIAQMEGMKQAQEGDKYTFDMDRALGHLAEPQGVESIFLGALGGGLQTGITEVLMESKERARAAREDAISAKPVENSNLTPKDQAVLNEAKFLNDYMLAKQKATTQEEHNAVDKKYLTDSAVNAYTSGNLDKRIVLYDELSKKKDSTPDEQQRAKMALDEFNRIKGIGDREGVNGYQNPVEILSAALNLDEANKAVTQATDDLNRLQISEAPDADAISKAQNNLAELMKARDEMQTVLKDLKSKETQDNIKKEKDKVKQAKIDAKEDAKSEVNTKTVTKTKNEKKIKTSNFAANNDKYDFIASESPHANLSSKISRVDVKDPATGNRIGIMQHLGLENKEGASVPIDATTLKELTGDTDTHAILIDDISLRDEKNNPVRQAVLISPEKKNIADEYKSTLPANATVLYNQEPGKPFIGRTIKSLMPEMESDPNMKLILGKNVFTMKDLDNFIKNQSDKDLAQAWENSNKNQMTDESGGLIQPKSKAQLLTNDLINQFIDHLNSERAKGSSVSTPTSHTDMTKAKPDDINMTEPDRDFDASDVANKLEDSDNKYKINLREEPMAVNYLVAQYEKTSDGRLRSTGVINQEYLVNSNPKHVYQGAELIIEAYDGEPVPTVNIVDGKSVIVNHNARTALDAGREIPIAIYLRNKNGSKGKMIGFLPETRWLEEVDSTGKRIHIYETDKGVTNKKVEEVIALRTKITEAFKNNTEEVFTATITNVSPGVPYTKNRQEFESINKRMPNVVKDVKNTKGISSPFGYFVNGVFSNGNTTVPMANAKALANLPNGTPILLIPSGKNQVIGVPARSKRLKEIGKSLENMSQGIKAHLGVNFKGANAYNGYASQTNGKVDLIGSAKGIRDYLKSFVNLSPKGIFDSTSVPIGTKAVTVSQDANNRTVIIYGEVGNPKRGILNVTKLRDTIKGIKDDAGKIESIDEAIKPLLSFLGEMRHNFRPEEIGNGRKFVGIVDGGLETLGQGFQSRYMETVSTNYEVAGKSDGKDIYTIQPVISFSEGITPTKATKAPKVPREPVRPPIKKEEKPVSKEVQEKKKELLESKRKSIELLAPEGGNGVSLTESDESATPLQSIAIEEPSLEENPLSKVDPNNTEELADAIKTHCRKK